MAFLDDFLAGSMNKRTPAGTENYPGMAQPQSGSPVHSGMFGIRGVGRDLLGLIGDALLVQSGNKPIYRGRREQEQMGDALSGFADDPMAAIQRLTQMGQGEAAVNLYNSHLKNEREGMESRAQSANQMSSARKNNVATGNEQLDRVLGVLSAGNNPTAYPTALARARKIAEENGIDISQFALPDEYNADAVNAAVGYGINPEKRYTADATAADRKTDNARQERQLKLEAAKFVADERRKANEATAAARKTAADAKMDQAKVESDKASNWRSGANTAINETGRKDRAAAKDGGSTPTSKTLTPPSNFKPRKVGDTLKMDGVVKFRSPDGKNWIPTGN